MTLLIAFVLTVLNLLALALNVAICGQHSLKMREHNEAVQEAMASFFFADGDEEDAEERETRH